MTAAPTRPIVAHIDLDALAANTQAVRQQIGPAVRFYGVCKGDAYGAGILETAPRMLEAGADAIATADPADVVALRQRGIRAPILLYPCSAPADAAAIAALGAIVTVHDRPGLQAFAHQRTPVAAHLKVDCGFGRLGFAEDELPAAFEALRAAGTMRLVGLTTHLAHTEVGDKVARQIERFRRAVAMAAAHGFADIEHMVASSRITIGYPDLCLNAVNPGRILYGILEPPWTDIVQPARVVRSLASRVLQVRTLPAGTEPGYLDGVVLRDPLRIAIIGAGFGSGLPRLANGMPVLIRGREAPTVGMRSTEHTIVDVSAIPDAAPGDEAVILGCQGDREITPVRFAEVSGIPLIEMLPRLLRGAVRRYA